METIEELVRRAQAGDLPAFEEIVRRLSRRAVATAHAITGDLHAGEEAAQDAFVVAWKKIGDVREPERFRGWFGKVLARIASRGRPARPAPLPPGTEPSVPPESPEPQALPDVVRGLKPMYRQVLALRYVEGLSYREISDALGISVARVKSRLYDGRELVKSRLVRRGKR